MNLLKRLDEGVVQLNESSCEMAYPNAFLLIGLQALASISMLYQLLEGGCRAVQLPDSHVCIALSAPLAATTQTPFCTPCTQPRSHGLKKMRPAGSSPRSLHAVTTTISKSTVRAAFLKGMQLSGCTGRHNLDESIVCLCAYSSVDLIWQRTYQSKA